MTTISRSFAYYFTISNLSAEPRSRERSKHPLLRLCVFVAVSAADSPRGPRCPQRLREMPRAYALGAVLAFFGGESGRGADQRGEVGAGEAVFLCVCISFLDDVFL